MGQVERVVVRQDTAFPKIAAIFAETPLETLKAWQAFHVADDAAPYLSKRFVDANFEFRNKELAGQPEQQPRWKRGVDLVDGALGESVGRVYVARYFPPESKAKMDALVGRHPHRPAAAGSRSCAWMGAETKAKALEKLAQVHRQDRLPDKWRDYSHARRSKRDDLYGNVARATAFEWASRRRAAERAGGQGRVGHDARRRSTPTTTSTNNEIVFPAAILQAPFFDPDADTAINYGGIGGVIGHEISHGFDDQGRKSDGDGVLRDWWTAEDAAKFKVQADRLGAQYSAFEPLPGAQGARRPDHGREHRRPGRAVCSALDAYHASLKGKPAPVHRRPDRRPAGVPRLGPGVARRRSATRRCASRWSPTRTRRRVYRVERHDPQHRRLVRGLRREAGRQALCRARRSASGSGEIRAPGNELDLIGMGSGWVLVDS